MFDSSSTHHTTNMKLFLLTVVCLAVASASPADKRKRDILPGDPRYGTDYHNHHHHHENEVEISKSNGGYVGTYSVPETLKTFESSQKSYGPPNYEPSPPFNNDYLGPVDVKHPEPTPEYGTPEPPHVPHNSYLEPVIQDLKKKVPTTTYGGPKSVEHSTPELPATSYGTPSNENVKTTHDVGHSDTKVQSTHTTTTVHKSYPTEVHGHDVLEPTKPEVKVSEHVPVTQGLKHFTDVKSFGHNDHQLFSGSGSFSSLGSGFDVQNYDFSHTPSHNVHSFDSGFGGFGLGYQPSHPVHVTKHTSFPTPSFPVHTHTFPAPEVHHSYPLPEVHHSYPVPEVHHSYPLPEVQHNYPLPQVQHNYPLPPVQHNYPLPTVQHNYPLPPVQHNYPLPTVQHNYPLPQVQHNYPLPQVHQSYPLPQAHHVPQVHTTHFEKPVVHEHVHKTLPDFFKSASTDFQVPAVQSHPLPLFKPTEASVKNVHVHTNTEKESITVDNPLFKPEKVTKTVTHKENTQLVDPNNGGYVY